VQQIITALPQHLLAVLLGSLSGVLQPGKHWAEALTEVALTESGPLEHVVRGVGVLVTLLEVLPKYRYVFDHPSERHRSSSIDKDTCISSYNLVFALPGDATCTPHLICTALLRGGGVLVCSEPA
jgi:hypothetical protein